MSTIPNTRPGNRATRTRRAASSAPPATEQSTEAAFECGRRYEQAVAQRDAEAATRQAGDAYWRGYTDALTDMRDRAGTTSLSPGTGTLLMAADQGMSPGHLRPRGTGRRSTRYTPRGGEVA